MLCVVSVSFYIEVGSWREAGVIYGNMQDCPPAHQHDMTGPRRREDKQKGGGGLDFSEVAFGVAYMGNSKRERWTVPWFVRI